VHLLAIVKHLYQDARRNGKGGSLFEDYILELPWGLTQLMKNCCI